MFAGRDALKSIDRSISDLRKEIDRVSERVSRANDDLARYRRQQSEAFRQLAAIRLDIAQREPVIERLTRSEQDALQLLDQRNKHIRELNRRLEQDESLRADLYTKRTEQAEVVAAVETELAEVEQALAEKLLTDMPYQDVIQALGQAERIADEAARKTELAREDREQKGKPYEDDPLFMYLWERDFGTDKYSANPLIRSLDRWVAGLIRFHDARLNYARLLELPVRLGEHAETVAGDVQRMATEFEQLEDERRRAAGVTTIEHRLAEAEDGLTVLDEALSQEAGEKTALERERDMFLRGEDDHYGKAIDLLIGSLSRQDLRSLHREALLTPEREDEELVDEIDDLADEIEEIEEDLDDWRDMVRKLEKRRIELEDVRARFVQKRYDSRESYFDDDDFLKSLLRGIARGAISGGGLWREIERHQRRRAPRRTRSSGDIGQWGGNRSHPWSGGSGKRSGSRSGGGFRKGGGFGGGGFRRGGGFGGGGFKTGGGF